jgi:hypothetical protein
MNDLIVVPQTTPWHKLKALVLDRRLLPNHQASLQSGAGRIRRVVWPGAPCWLHQGHSERVARSVGGPRARRGFDQRADHRRAQTGGRGRRQWAAGAGTGQRDHPRKSLDARINPEMASAGIGLISAKASAAALRTQLYFVPQSRDHGRHLSKRRQLQHYIRLINSHRLFG